MSYNNLVLVWHGHHDVLCEFLNFEKRVTIIKREKSDSEIPLRLKLMRPVAHPEKFPIEWVEAAQKSAEAYQKLEEVRQMWKKANDYLGEVSKEWYEANKKYDEAYNEWREAAWKAEEADKKFKPQLEVLHREECSSDCPWDGWTIFPGES